MRRLLKRRIANPNSRELWDGIWAGRRPEPPFGQVEMYCAALGYVGAEDRILDVGGGAGHFLAMAGLLAGGVDRHLYEQSAFACGSALERGWAEDAVRARFVDELSVPTGRYDVVACLDVVQRVDAPAALVGELFRAVRPGGVVVVSIPRVPGDAAGCWDVDEADLAALMSLWAEPGEEEPELEFVQTRDGEFLVVACVSSGRPMEWGEAYQFGRSLGAEASGRGRICLASGVGMPREWACALEGYVSGWAAGYGLSRGINI